MAIKISGNTVIDDSQNISVSGNATANSFVGDGSNLTNLPGGGNVTEATASGTLSDGSKVIVNADGTVSVVTQSETTGAGVGSETVFESATTYYTTAVYDSSNNRVVIAYTDAGNSDRGTAIVGTVSGTSISFGTPVVFNSSGGGYHSAVYDSTNQKVVIAYRDSGNSGYGTAVVGTVSGTSISFGSETTFNSNSTSDLSAVYDSTNGKVVITYWDLDNSAYGTAVVGTVSGTSISFGTPVVFESATVAERSATFDSSNGKVVIAYQDNGNSTYGTAIVGTVSGTSISFGSPVVFNAAGTYQLTAIYDSTNNKVVIAYKDNANSNYGTAIVGTVSGTSISFGSSVVFNSTGNTNDISATYDSTNGKVVITYRDPGNSEYGTAVVGTVSGTSISFGSPVVFESAQVAYVASTFDSTNGKVVISYQDYENSYYGTAVVLSTTGFSVHQLGSPTLFQSSATYNPSAAYDSSNNKVVIAYRNSSSDGKAIVGEVSGTGITFGTPVTFDTSVNTISATFDSTNNRVVIAYSDGANNTRGTAIVGQVSGTSINFGTPEPFASNANSFFINATFDSTNNRVVIAYRDNGNSSYGTAVVGQVSGTSITFGTPVPFEYASTENISTTFDSSNGKVVIAYRDDGNSYQGTAIVGTVNTSNNSISFGTSEIFETGISNSIKATFDSTNNKVVIAYADGGPISGGGANYFGTAVVGEVSGTSITFGTPAVFNSAGTYQTSATFDSSSGKAVIAYMDGGSAGNYGTAIAGTVSGTSISFGTPVVFEYASTNHTMSAIYDSSNDKVVIAYQDGGNSDYGTSVVFSPVTMGTNLTSENYIGISDGAFTNGQTATIQLIGSVDDAQSSLTPGQKYYVQDDGTLAESGSVFAGTAVSSTSLVVKS